MARKISLVLLISAFSATSACSVHHVHRGETVNPKTRWALLPMLNYSENPHAGERAEAISATLLRVRGVSDLTHYPAAKSESALPELDEQRRFEEALSWARGKGFVYALAGSVEEWTYRTGPDGDAAVGLTLQVVEVTSGRVLWAASGSRSGWGREAVSGVAQKLIETLLSELRI